MTGEAVLTGTARAVCSALAARHAWAAPGVDLCGAAILGAGDADLPTLRRAAAWDGFDFSGLSVRSLILAELPARGADARAVLERAAEARLNVLVIERGALRRLRLEDLVGRPLQQFDEQRIRTMIAGKRVLITGGGGSIGAQLARRVAELAPARLTLLDSSEHNLFRIGLDLPDATPALADIRDAPAMRRWFARERPQIVFHAAALKQVPLVEAFPSEGVLSNVGGLRHVAEAARETVADLIFVSTDKAVDPSGVMGASKRLGELYCQALDRRGPRRAVPVRLGNVLGSSGSVTPTFEAQLAAGGPLTVTDPEVTRFFLSIPQAADALLQAAAVGLNMPARGVALVIDMGEALPVVELAREVIRLAGLRPGVDAPIVFTGLRPGEKLHEQLVARDEWREADPAAGVIAVASPPRGLSELQETMERLCQLARGGADAAVAEALFAALAPAVEQAPERARAG
jgi:O-antigen biosynthesis protein WbqV